MCLIWLSKSTNSCLPSLSTMSETNDLKENLSKPRFWIWHYLENLTASQRHNSVDETRFISSSTSSTSAPNEWKQRNSSGFIPTNRATWATQTTKISQERDDRGFLDRAQENAVAFDEYFAYDDYSREHNQVL